MGLLIATTFGLALWIVLWALGTSGLDSFLLALLVMLLGAGGRVLIRHLPGGSTRSSQP
jgi:hypothetical protein